MHKAPGMRFPGTLARRTGSSVAPLTIEGYVPIVILGLRDPARQLLMILCSTQQAYQAVR